MKIGSTFNHEIYGPLKITKKRYSRMGNKSLWIGVDENGEEHELDGTEKPAKMEKESPKFLKEAAEVLGMAQGPKGEDADEDYIIEAVIPRVLEQIRQPENGKDGADADVELIIKEMIPLVMDQMPRPKELNEVLVIERILSRIKIPQDGKPGEKGKDGSPDTPVQVKDKLETLKGDDRLDASAIKNLPRTQIGGGGSFTGLAKVDVGDTPGTLEDKIIAGANITVTKGTNADGTKKLTIAGSAGGSGSPGGSDTQVQFNDGGSFGGDAGLVFNKTTNKLTGAGDIELTSTDTVDGTKRLLVSSYERAVSPTHYGEVIRADWNAADAKVAIAFRDNFTNPGTPVSKGWLLAHDYLQYTDSAYTKSFVDANVNTGTDRITITSHGFSNADRVKLWSTTTLPTGIAHLQQYYAKVIDTNTIELYRESGLTNIINITDASSGGTHYIADVTLGNNPHKHMSLEVTDSTGALQSRLEFPYDKDSTWIKVIDADFVLTGGKKVQMVGENGVNKDITFGIDETTVYTRWALRQDSTTESGSNVGSDFKIVRFSDAGVALDSPITIKRSTGLITTAGDVEVNGQNIDLDSPSTASVIIDRNASTNFASNIWRTNGTDQWTAGLRNDSTNNLYIRDNINGVNIIAASQGATPTVTLGGSWRYSNAIVPATSDGAALGSTALQWSDIFLAEGGTINWDNSDAILTQAGDVLTLSSADLKVTTPGNASTSVLTTDGTQAMTNKRRTRRLTTTNAPGATPTTNTDNVDVMNFTGLGTAITSMTTNLSGTPVDGDLLEFRFTDDGTARGITWGASFAATTVALPTTTVISTMLRVGFEYSGSTWKCIATC